MCLVRLHEDRKLLPQPAWSQTCGITGDDDVFVVAEADALAVALRVAAHYGDEQQLSTLLVAGVVGW